MAHTGPLSNTVAVHYDPAPPKLDGVDGLGATNNRRIGTQTLVGQREAEQPAMATVATATPAPEQSRVRKWLKAFVDYVIVPPVSVMGTEWLVSCTPEEYQVWIRPLAHMFNATVTRPAAVWLSNRLVDELSDPRALLDKAKNLDPQAAAQAFWDAIPKKLPSKAEVGRAARELILDSTDTAATVLLLNVAARMTDVPGLERALKLLAPMFARTVKTLFDLGFDQLYPMTTVEPEDVPKADDTLKLCAMWPATVTKVSGNLNGTFDAAIRFADTADHPWVSLSGDGVVSTGQQKRVVRVTKLSDAALTIGVGDKYKLTGLGTKSYGEHTGWTLTASKMTAVKNAAPATLEYLTVSPNGWLEGAFVRDGKRGLLGGKARDGVEWPEKELVTEDTEQEPAAPQPLVVTTDNTLAGRINAAITTRHNRWLLATGFAALGWWTEHKNLLGQKNPKVKDVIAAHKAHPTTTWVSRLNPRLLLADISPAEFIPDCLRGFPKLELDPYQLTADPGPSLTFKMTTSLQLFEKIPTATATGLTIVWLPFASSPVQVRAAQLKFGEALTVDGLEADPRGGVRSPHAQLKVPLPSDTFSLASILLSADYLSIGRDIDFRHASMTMQSLSIGEIVTIDSLMVAMQRPGKDPRLTATTKGAVNLPGVKSMRFGGAISWGGGEAAEGHGEIKGSGLTQNGLFAAEELSGTLDVEKGVATGTMTAKDFVLEWNGYKLKTNAEVTLDRHGVEKFALTKVHVWKGGAAVGHANNVRYERGQSLTVGRLALDIPTSGPIRATKEKPAKAAPQVVATNLDLSSLVRTVAPSEKPKKKAGLSVTNLGKLEMGPASKPFLALDFAKAKSQPTPEGSVGAYVSGDLRGFKLNEMLVQVGPSSTNAADVRVKLAGLKGAGYSIESAIYDDGKLEVTNARIRIDHLLGNDVPGALRGLKSQVDTSFTIDTRANKLLALTAKGELRGKLFDGAVKITNATAKLDAKPGTISDKLTDHLSLDGTIDGSVTVNAYGIEATLTGSFAFPGGKPTLSGRGTNGHTTLVITNVTFVDNKPVFGTARATIAAPLSDVVEFRASPSKTVTEDERDKVVVWVANQPVVGTKKPARQIGVHLPEIHVAGDTFVLKADDVIVNEGKDQTVTISAAAKLALGILSGNVRGSVTLKISGESPVPDDDSIAFDLSSVTLGGLTLTDLHYEKGKLKAKTASARTPAVLGGVPGGFGLDNIAWNAQNLAIDIASKTVSVDKLGATIGKTSTLGGALSFASASADVGLEAAPLDSTSLIPRNWAVTLATTGARLGTDTFSIGGSAKIVIDRNGLRDGEVTKASLECGAAEASVGKIALTADGWDASEVKVVVGRNPTGLGFDPIAKLPAWLKSAADYRVAVTFPLSYRGKQLVWPSLSDVELDVQKAGITLPGGISGSFERTASKKTVSFAAKPPKGGFSVGLQIPLAHGVGIEIGGSLEHEVSLEAKDVALQDGPQIGFGGQVTGTAALRGRVRVGVFGGVPALFTVSAGLYAGLDLTAAISANATGAWNLPKTAGQDTGGAVQMYLKMGDESNAGTMLTGEAGAYASIHVLGFGRTIEKPLAKAEIARIFAHGFAELSTENGLRLLPTGEFPTHSLRLHPKLDDLLTGGDTRQAIATAYQTVDRGVGKMKASEELLDGVTAADTAKPWKGKTQAKLEQDHAAAVTKLTKSTKAVKEAETALQEDRDCLALAREKLAKYIVERDKGQPIKARAAMTSPVAARLTNYKKHKGRVDAETTLDLSQLRARVTAKEEEITELEKRIAVKEELDIAARAQQVTDLNAKHKAEKKANLAGMTVGKVKEDLAWRQRRLIEMYGTLQDAHRKTTERAARSAAKTVKLEEDLKTARQHVARLKADPESSETERLFWDEQRKYLEAELLRVKAEAAPAPITLSDDATLAFNRAKEKQPTAIAKLSAKVMAELHEYESQIEAKTIALSENFTQLAKLGDVPGQARDKLEKVRTDLLVDLNKLQTALKGALERADAMAE